MQTLKKAAIWCAEMAVVSFGAWCIAWMLNHFHPRHPPEKPAVARPALPQAKRARVRPERPPVARPWSPPRAMALAAAAPPADEAYRKATDYKRSGHEVITVDSGFSVAPGDYHWGEITRSFIILDDGSDVDDGGVTLLLRMEMTEEQDEDPAERLRQRAWRTQPHAEGDNTVGLRSDAQQRRAGLAPLSRKARPGDPGVEPLHIQPSHEKIGAGAEIWWGFANPPNDRYRMLFAYIRRGGVTVEAFGMLRDSASDGGALGFLKDVATTVAPATGAGLVDPTYGDTVDYVARDAEASLHVDTGFEIESQGRVIKIQRLLNTPPDPKAALKILEGGVVANGRSPSGTPRGLSFQGGEGLWMKAAGVWDGERHVGCYGAFVLGDRVYAVIDTGTSEPTVPDEARFMGVASAIRAR